MPDKSSEHHVWFKALASFENTGVIMIDPDGSLAFVSDRARELLRCEIGDSVDKCVSILGEEFAELVSQAHCGDQVMQERTLLVDIAASDGQPPRKFSVVLHGINVESCMGFLCIIRDRTEEELLERELELSSRYQTICRLYQNLAHDLKTPTAAATYSLEALRRMIDQTPFVDLDKGHKIAAFIGHVSESVKMLNESLTMVLDELTTSQTDTGLLDLRHVLLKVMDLVDMQAKKQGVATSVQLPQEEVLIVANAQRIKHAILNILMNALEAMPDGGKLAMNLNVDDQRCVIAASDDGPGIPVSIHSKIFERHFTTKMTGTGIGLHSVQEVISKLEGKVWFDSEAGVGTTFYIELPVTSHAT